MRIVRQAGDAIGNAPLAAARASGFSRVAAASLLQRGARRLSSLRWALPPRSEVAKALGVGVAYYVGAELAFWVGTLTYFFAPLWPPNMILLCALLMAPYRSWWLYIAAVLPAHIAAETRVGMQALPLLGAFICNVALALSSAAGLRRLSAGPPWLDGLAKAWTFILVVAIGAPALVASGVAALGWLSRGTLGGTEFAMRWGVANLLGGVALAPIFVTWIGEGRAWLRGISAWRALEASCLTLSLLASAYIGFPAAAAEYPVLACVPIPLMLWAAVRFGPRGASGAILLVSMMALAGAIEGRAPFAAAPADHTVLSLQMFLAVLSAPFLVLAAVVVERRQAVTHATLAKEELQSILDNTPACIYVKDLRGRFIFANRSARALLPRELVGRTTDELFPPDFAASWSADDASVVDSGIPLTREHAFDLGAGIRLYLVTKFVLREPGEEAYAVCAIATDITEFRRAQYEVQDLSAHLLSAQDEERRRIARELHDGTGQGLVAVILNLRRLLGSGPVDDNARAITEESIALLGEMQSEIRTLSHLLHPPLLDDAGLAPALTWYVEGFAKRSGIDAKLQLPADIGITEKDVATALFRIVQESLTNVHRHSGSRTADIRLERTCAAMVLTISDTGRGMASEASDGEGDQIRSLGVGIAGMRARVKQLGGTLDIRSGPGGTTVTSIVPHAGQEIARHAV